MRPLSMLDAWRNHAWELTVSRGQPFPADECGCFEIPSPEDGGSLRCIAAKGGGWEHVSVSREDRCPTWGEMDFLARQFFRNTETAMQLHVPPSEHVNHMPYCLHLWRPCGLKKIPTPPSWMVGPDSAKGKGRSQP